MLRRVLVLVLFFLGGTPFALADHHTPRAFFVSMIQRPAVLASAASMERLIEAAKSSRTETLFVQIYYANRAVFKTTIGDTAPYAIYKERVGEDPFALLIRKAHQAGIRVHAWINLLSLGDNDKAVILKKYGPGILTRNLKPKTTLEDYRIDGQFFLEPGDERVQENLLILVGDILRAYPDLDGLQFDYIRYPDLNPAYGHSPANVAAFLQATGQGKVREDDPAWRDWKRGRVTKLLTSLVERARMIRPGIVISTTGCMPHIRALEEAFQEWPAWINTGLVDFVTIMNYTSDTDKFERWALMAKDKVNDPGKMGIAVGAYVLKDFPDKFEREWSICEHLDAGPCAVFHYGNLLEENGEKLGAVLRKGRKP